MSVGGYNVARVGVSLVSTSFSSNSGANFSCIRNISVKLYHIPRRRESTSPNLDTKTSCFHNITLSAQNRINKNHHNCYSIAVQSLSKHCLTKNSNLSGTNTFSQVRNISTGSSGTVMSNDDVKIYDEESRLRDKYIAKEKHVQTPYGHIALMEWGDPEAPHKILCCHGWLDNSGSFERLIPYVLDHKDNGSKYHVVAMDMPGVGLSSHRPPGSDYTLFSNIMEMRRVAQHMGWKKITLLSHSLGAHLSFFYSCVYPDQVETMISIDLAQPIGRQVHNWNLTIADAIEDHFKSEYHHEDDPITNIRVPVYSESDAIKRLMEAHSSSLTEESAYVLLKRGATRQSWGYVFNRDVRWRHLSLELRPDDDMTLKYLHNTFRPNLFVIRADRSPYHRPEETRMRYYRLFEKNCPIFRDSILEGTHHLHMNTPQPVAAAINDFLDHVRERNGEGTKPDSSIENSSAIHKSNL